MQGLSSADKGYAYRKLRSRVLDARVAQAIDAMREAEEGHVANKDVANRQHFKQLGDSDRKLLYKEYGFSDSENELAAVPDASPEAAAAVAEDVATTKHDETTVKSHSVKP